MRWIAAALILLASAPAPAARDVLGHTVRSASHGARRVISVDWQKRLVAWELLTYAPRSLAAPAIDTESGELIVGTRDGLVRALDADGNELWSTRLGAAVRGTIIEPTSAPAMTEERVFIGGADGRLHALDRFTGEPIWKEPAYVAGEIIENPVIAGDTVFVGTDHDSVHAIDARTGAVRWVYRREDSTQTLSIRGGTGVSLGGNRLYAGFSDGSVVALAPADGRLLWEARLATPSPGTFPDADAAPIFRDGVVYAASYAEGVFAMDAATGTQRWKYQTRGPVALTLQGDRLFAGGANTAVAIDTRSGARVWSVGLGNAAVGKASVAGDVVVFPSTRGQLFLSQRTGKPLQTWDPGSGFNSAPAVNGRTLYALSNDGFLYRLSLVTGLDAR